MGKGKAYMFGEGCAVVEADSTAQDTARKLRVDKAEKREVKVKMNSAPSYL